MANKEATKLEPKVILLIVAVVVLVALAIWQGTKSLGSGASDVSFESKIQAPPDSTRPPGFEKPGSQPTSDKQ